MNKDTYTYLLANPERVDKDHLQELSTVLESYPYFQSARALQLKGLKNENSFLYNDALKLTAAYTTDRDMLFEFITSESFVQNEISELILQQSDAVKEMEVEAEDISEKISLEIDKQLKAEIKKAEAILDPKLFEKKISSITEMVEQEEVEEIDETAPEETLKTDEPLPFSQQDTRSFAEWLKLTKATPIDRSSEDKKPEKESTPPSDKARKFQLIEKFIQEQPKLEPKDISAKNKNLAKPYTQTQDTLMTETLAKVYLQQKNYKKAIQAYKILILKNPEKSGFFADQIRAIKKLIKTEK
ncbi:MAG: hypothetical protein HKN48_01355 [Flavobacteriaceae bacterium]|nr:hypothetical protein [Flavobacteriaceae bacterium]